MVGTIGFVSGHGRNLTVLGAGAFGKVSGDLALDAGYAAAR